MSPTSHPAAWTTPPAAVSGALPRRSQQLQQKGTPCWAVQHYELYYDQPATAAGPTVPDAATGAQVPAAEPTCVGGAAAPASVPASAAPHPEAPGQNQGWAAFAGLAAQACVGASDVPGRFRPALSAAFLDEDPMRIDPSLTWEQMAEIGNAESRASEYVRRFTSADLERNASVDA